ncbi:hypothetical protein AX768_02280 [Burkholderia sp. PAMC 28687]|uniref:hypothetical protein n=1 Tax=Burkholderia sp. PAMC 28687 TaxID=1795874 RepID=UPI00078439F4|nr:hypothetical protein [Burkholderia sp. PAMC 28687]AMM13116.1 hypothetical protein AX768_02280 [Burkholderia sp. PAMC 28687]
MKTWNYDELTAATEAVSQGLLERIEFDPHQQDYYELQAWGAFVLWHRLTNDVRAELPECAKDFKRLEKPFKNFQQSAWTRLKRAGSWRERNGGSRPQLCLLEQVTGFAGKNPCPVKSAPPSVIVACAFSEARTGLRYAQVEL